MSGFYPIFQAKREILGEFLDFFQVPAHLHHEVINLKLVIIFNTVIEQLRESAEHGDSLAMRESDFLEELYARDEFVLDGAGEKGGVFMNFRNSDALEEIHGGSQSVLDAAS